MYKLTDGDRFGRSHLARLARPKATPQSNLAYIYIKFKKKTQSNWSKDVFEFRGWMESRTQRIRINKLLGSYRGPRTHLEAKHSKVIRTMH